MLENDHVIGKEQIRVSILKRGPSGDEISSEYKRRNDPTSKIEVGKVIIKVVKNTPDGVLVFFPSYSMMQECVNEWKVRRNNHPSILDSIGNYKQIVYEPKDRREMQREMERYYAAIKQGKGAVFFSICRGKVSEGLDFADEKGRAVIVVGLPFPPSKDPKVVLKQQYLDTNKERGLLSPGQWYNQQSSRAVNQAIGRVIRHRSDYGAIILADLRFAEPRVHSLLSKWLRPEIRIEQHFEDFEQRLIDFFKNKKHSAGRPIEPVFIPKQPTQPENITQTAYEEKQKLEPVVFKDENANANTIGDALKTLSSQTQPTAVKTTKFNPGKATEYMDKIRKILNASDFKSFQMTLKRYKVREVTISELFTLLDELFSRYGWQKVELLMGFSAFVPEKHERTWKEFMANTNMSVGIQQLPEDVLKPETSSKCIICHGPFEVPFQAPCLHIACFHCWSDSLRTKGECPLCKQRVRMPLLKKFNK